MRSLFSRAIVLLALSLLSLAFWRKSVEASVQSFRSVQWNRGQYVASYLEQYNETVGLGHIYLLTQAERRIWQDDMLLLAQASGLSMQEVHTARLKDKHSLIPISGDISVAERTRWRSHFDAWGAFIDSGASLALFLEDDVDFLTDIMEILRRDVDLMKRQGTDIAILADLLEQKHCQLSSPVRPVLVKDSLAAYILTRRAVLYLFSHITRHPSGSIHSAINSAVFNKSSQQELSLSCPAIPYFWKHTSQLTVTRGARYNLEKLLERW